jgi:hypothetical protein
MSRALRAVLQKQKPIFTFSSRSTIHHSAPYSRRALQPQSVQPHARAQGLPHQYRNPGIGVKVRQRSTSTMYAGTYVELQ